VKLFAQFGNRPYGSITMSRIGKKIIEIPNTVSVTIQNNELTSIGPKGQMKVQIPESISHSYENGILSFSRTSDDKKIRALHGLTRALTNSAIVGVLEGFEKKLGIEGVGFRVELKGKRLLLTLGFSHPVLFIPPEGIEFAVFTPTSFSVKGINKQLVGEVAAIIRNLRPPEPYKGKGVRYDGEVIRRKAGKSSKK